MGASSWGRTSISLANHGPEEGEGSYYIWFLLGWWYLHWGTCSVTILDCRLQGSEIQTPRFMHMLRLVVEASGKHESVWEGITGRVKQLLKPLNRGHQEIH